MILTIPHTDGEHPACAQAPKLILEQLEKIWANTYGYPIKKPEVKEGSIENIEDAKIYLGGDHSITYYTVKHFKKNNPNGAFIVFDAHPDVFQAFDYPSHQDYLKFLIEEGILSPEEIVVVGIRAPHPSEIKYYKEKEIKYYPFYGYMPLIDTCDAIMEFLRKFDSIYISIDMDILDPVYAPGVSYVEPNGLTSRELFYFLQRLKKTNKIKALDVVEVNPENDINNITTKTAARIIADFL